MANEIIQHGDDWYAVWNTNTDLPECWGTKAEIEEYLVEQIEEDFRQRAKHEIEVMLPRRFGRAFIRGTSSMVGGSLDANSTVLYGGIGQVKVSDLPEFLASWVEDETRDMGGRFERMDLVRRWKDGE